MKNPIMIFFFFVLAVNAQNRSLIKTTFYNQNINDIDRTAIQHNFSPKETIFIEISFKANSNGEIFDFEISQDDKIFKNDLEAVVNKIPKLDPNEYLYKGNEMKYLVSMRFKLLSKRKRKKIQQKEEQVKIEYDYFSIKEYFPVKTIEINDYIDWKNEKFDQLPLTDNCKGLIQVAEQKKCISSEISGYVNKKFDTGIAAELGLPSGRYEVIIVFYISKEGEVVNITAESSVPELAEEGVRVINTLPKFKSPSKLNGKPVIFRYTFPVRFVIA
jgi:hypothetical protein